MNGNSDYLYKRATMGAISIRRQTDTGTQEPTLKQTIGLTNASHS